MGHMKYEHTKPYEDWFWTKNRIDLIKGWVKSIDFEKKNLKLDAGNPVAYDQLILATGSKANKFGWPGQELTGVQSLISFQDLQLMETNTHNAQRAVVIGGGLIGVEMAEMLHSRHIPVTFLIRETHFWRNVLPSEEASLIDHHLAEHRVDLRPETELAEILDDGTGKVKGVRTLTGEIINCEFVGITVGVHPNIDLVKNTTLQTDIGILVDDYLETNIPGVFAIGDCAQIRKPLPHRKSIEPVWYAGRMMGETVAQTVTGNKTRHVPGIWFNSAKFFDIEYQTYGNVLADTPVGHVAFYWEAKDRKKCLKIIYERSTRRVTGVNLFGIRNRHEVWDEWIKKGKSLEQVIQHLPKANFDPEFFKHWEGEIQQKYNEEFPDNPVRIKGKSLFEKIFG